MHEKNYSIKKDEKNILEDFEKGEFKSVDNLSEELKLAKEAARNFFKKRQSN